jgi:hypothetical protein
MQGQLPPHKARRRKGNQWHHLARTTHRHKSIAEQQLNETRFHHDAGPVRV